MKFVHTKPAFYSIALRVAFVTLALTCSALHAQVNRPKFEAAAAFDTTLNLSAVVGDVRVTVDKFTGRFSIEKSNGTPILFQRNGYGTSFTNVRVGPFVFTNNTLRGPQSPEGTRTMPEGYAMIENNAIVFRTRIETIYGAFDVEQRFAPTVDNVYNFVRITTRVTNRTGSVMPIGSLHMLDLMAGGSDAVDVYIDNRIVDFETGYNANAIPKTIDVRSIYVPFLMRARLDGDGTTKPDFLVIGRWQYNGYLGAASWNYQPSGLMIYDDAMLMQWNQRAIAPGQSFTTVIDYGLESSGSIVTDANISCLITGTVWDDSLQTYVPNPFDVRARVTNTGTTPLSNVVVVIAPLLNGLSLATGEPASKTIPTTIQPNASADVIWKVTAPKFPRDTIVSVQLRIASPPIIAATCTGQTTIPAARIKHVVAAELFCGPFMQLLKDNVGGGYEPNPFLIEPVITNTGTVDLDSVYITIILPPRLSIISGAVSRLLNPFPLLPGSSLKPFWLVQASPSFAADTIEYTLRITHKQGLLIECKQKIFLPGVDVVLDCVENGASLREKDFWFSYGPDHSNTEPLLTIAAEQHTDIRVEILPANIVFISHIFPKNIVQYPLDRIVGVYINGHGQTVHLNASEPVAAYLSRSSVILSEASSVIPATALGTKHTMFGYTSGTSITAIEDGTQFDNGATTLQKGETVFFSRGDGGFIDATKPISVLRTDERVTGFLNIPANDGHSLIEIIPPHSLLGTEYIAVPFLTRYGGDYMQIYSTADTNQVRVNGVSFALPARGSSKIFLLTGPSHIQADKPVGVMQFSMPTFFDKPLNASPYGDGSMVTLMPVNRFATCHSFSTSIAQNIDFLFVTIVVFDGAQNAVSLDGRRVADTLFHRVGTSAYRYARVQISKGTHRISCSDVRGCGVVVYGFGLYDAFSFNTGYVTAKKGPTPNSMIAALTPDGFALDQTYPNPATGLTAIRYRLTSHERVTITLFDLFGRGVATLLDEAKEAGEHTLMFDLTSRKLASGVYHIRMESGGKALMRKMVVE